MLISLLNTVNHGHICVQETWYLCPYSGAGSLGVYSSIGSYASLGTSWGSIVNYNAFVVFHLCFQESPFYLLKREKSSVKKYLSYQLK